MVVYRCERRRDLCRRGDPEHRAEDRRRVLPHTRIDAAARRWSTRDTRVHGSPPQRWPCALEGAAGLPGEEDYGAVRDFRTGLTGPKTQMEIQKERDSASPPV